MNRFEQAGLGGEPTVFPWGEIDLSPVARQAVDAGSARHGVAEVGPTAPFPGLIPGIPVEYVSFNPASGVVPGVSPDLLRQGFTIFLQGGERPMVVLGHVGGGGSEDRMEDARHVVAEVARSGRTRIVVPKIDGVEPGQVADKYRKWYEARVLRTPEAQELLVSVAGLAFDSSREAVAKYEAARDAYKKLSREKEQEFVGRFSGVVDARGERGLLLGERALAGVVAGLSAIVPVAENARPAVVTEVPDTIEQADFLQERRVNEGGFGAESSGNFVTIPDLLTKIGAVRLDEAQGVPRKAMEETESGVKKMWEVGPIVTPTAEAGQQGEGGEYDTDYFAEVTSIDYYPAGTPSLSGYEIGLRSVAEAQGIEFDESHYWVVGGENSSGQRVAGVIPVLHETQSGKVFAVFSLAANGEVVPGGVTQSAAFIEMQSTVAEIDGESRLVLGTPDAEGNIVPIFSVGWDAEAQQPVGEWVFTSPWGGTPEGGMPLVEDFPEGLNRRAREMMGAGEGVDYSAIDARAWVELGLPEETELTFQLGYSGEGVNIAESLEGRRTAYGAEGQIVGVYDAEKREWHGAMVEQDYYGLGAAFIETVEVSDDITEQVIQEYLDGVRTEKCYITPQQETDIYGYGNIDVTLFQGTALVNKILRYVVVEYSDLMGGPVMGHEADLKFGCYQNGRLNFFTTTIKGQSVGGSWNNQKGGSVFEIFVGAELGKSYAVSLQHINPGSEMDNESYFEVIRKLWADKVYDSETKMRMVLLVAGRGSDNFTMEQIVALLSSGDAIFSPESVWPSVILEE